MWKLNTADLQQLKSGGGERFVHFMDGLIRAEAACGGLVQAAIATQLRVNIKDRGVDTEVKDRIPQDKCGWFSVPTCWQFKAIDATDVDDKEKKTKKNALQEEINKPYAAELIKNGYGYRLCLLGDLTPEKLKRWEAQLKNEALALNPHAEDPRVVHGGHLLDWAERFPGTVAWLRNLTQSVFHWEAWAANRRAITRKYVANQDWDSVRTQILQHVQFDQSCVGGDPCLFIGGAAGVGKTRLVLETLAELPQAPPLVVFVEDDQEARKIATWLANADRQVAILVADECSPQTRHFLNENLRGHVHRLRAISIDNAGEPLASAAGRVMLSPVDASKNAEAILEANFSHVPEDRRRQYAQFSRGFIRLAADMCLHDAEVAAGDLGSLLGSVERYVRHRLGENIELISAIALFQKVGYRDDVAGELDLLAQLTECERKQFHNAVRAVRESPGFVVQAGRYWYVTPEVVARVLFNEAWQRWVAPDLAGFIKNLPSEMQQQLIHRVATHARKEVRDEVGKFFRGWFSKLRPLDLTDPNTTSLAAALVEASPEEYLSRLRAVIETAQPGELNQIQSYASGARWGPRRTLVWLFERLVAFPEYFDDCEASLFRLALAESEPQFANNATAIWANLFSIYLSGTATPFERRMPALKKRIASSIIQEAGIGFGGLARALLPAEGHILGNPMIAGRLRPKDWQPATVGGERACLRSALTICADHLSNGGDNEHHRLAFKVLAKSLHHLLRRGMAEDLPRLVTPKNMTEGEARTLLQTVDKFLEIERTRGHAQVHERAGAYLRSVEEWSNLFRPTDFVGKLRSVCARDPWDKRFAGDLSKDKDDADDVAAVIVQQPLELAAQLDWLGSPEARSAERLGFALGRIDLAEVCGRIIFEHAIANNVAPVLRGYIRGMVYARRNPSADLFALMRTLESTHPRLAIDILGYAGDSFDALNQILQLVDSQSVSPKYLANLAMGLGRRELTADEVNRLMPYFTRAAASGDADTALAGVRFLEIYLLFEPRHSAQSCLASDATRDHAWQLVEASLPFLTSYDGSEWLEILKKLVIFDPDRAARLMGKALLAENFAFREQAERELTQLAATHPKSVMVGFGSALLDKEHGWKLQMAVCRDLVCQIPPEIVLSWVRAHGTEAARAIARHLPRPRLEDAGHAVVPEVLDTILREYDDEKVFHSFLAGAHSGEVWWGNGGDEFRHAAEIGKRFLNHPNHRIREWAKNEMSYRLRSAEEADQEHEERFLPS